MPTVRIIGAGRAGTSFARALAGAGWDVDTVLRRGDELARAAAGVDLLLLATPDAEIADVAGAVEPVAATVVAHLAGSLGLDVLAPHERSASLHPLVSLPDADLGAVRLRGAWFAVAGDPLVLEVVDALGGRAIDVPDDLRAAYHAAACIAANHVVALLGQVERVAGTAGVPLDAYLDLVRGAVDNVAALGPAAALTGPVARGDHDTVARHLAALDPAEHDAYEAMAAQAGRLLSCERAQGGGPREKVAGVVVVDRIARLRKELDAARARGETVGLVPTMGYLHDGHAALIRRAGAECDVVVVTDFVNPLQFGEAADLESYPRDLEHDAEVATVAGADFLFAPSVDEMYPERVQTTVHVAGVSEDLEGASRPGHFDGVATVVAKLFAIAGPCRAYFGEKDFQQLAVVRRLAADLSLPVDVVGCATVREPDGLAMSSRNVRLAPDERRAATVLHDALAAGAAALEAGERDPSAVAEVMAATIRSEPLARLDYAEAVDAHDLSVPDRLSGDVRLLVAARVGTIRLIDNMGATI